MKKGLLIICLCCLCSSVVRAQVLESRVNRTTVPEGETFLLTVELKDGKTSSSPDFAVLNKDFTVYSVSNAFRTNIINGNMEQSQQWNLVLMPNKSGKIVIPAIMLDNMQTKPIEINVGNGKMLEQANEKNVQKQVRFKMEGDVDNKQPFVQQQINYTLTIFDAGGLQGNAPIFLTNNTGDWIVKTLGEPKITTKNIDGKDYREIKFNYALFAQKSGELEVPAVQFDGYYLTSERRTDPFAGMFDDDLFISRMNIADVFATRHPVRLTVKPIKVKVLPADAVNGKNWWLPAENVHLYAEFVPNNPKFKVGEAISRNIYLQAVGVIDSQLPDLRFEEVDGIKQYPEKPQTEMRNDSGKIVSQAKTTNVYIPTKSGKVTLPEVKVNWYNVLTNKPEVAVLPAITINVAEGSGQSNMPEIQSEQAQKVNVLKTSNVQKTGKNNYSNISMMVSFVLGALLCLILLKLINVVKEIKTAGRKAKKVIHAARNKNLRLLRDNILEWASTKWPNDKFLSLQDVDEKLQDKEFRCELDKLSEALYAKDASEWNEALFIRVFKKTDKKNKVKRKYNEPLPKLYK
ncbi:MAG: protein BatD [Alphaproteobacteria bacterium]|nr:protein BatD [Alphaproteobacteria bacterium]